MKAYQILLKHAPWFAYILGIWYFCIRLLGYHFEWIPGDLGDSRFINYLLEHGYRWMTGGIPDFWNAGFMYPFENTVALSDSMLGTMPFYSVWRISGFSPETSYQLWWICNCTLNYWCSYFIFKKWFERKEIALILAWIFAFTIFNLGQLNYMQMIIRFMVPVVFYAAYRMISAPSIKYLSLYTFGIVYQLYCVVYTGVYLLYFSVLFILIYCIVSKEWKGLTFYLNKGKVAYTVIVLILSLAALLWIYIPYFQISKTIGHLNYIEIEPNIPYLKSYLFPHESSDPWYFLFKLARPDVPIWWLHFLFSGIFPFLAMIVPPGYLMYCKYKKIETSVIFRAITITSVIIILFHIRTKSGLTLYSVLFDLPGINSIRVLTRYMNVEIFLLLMGAGYLLAKIHHKYILLLFPLVFIDNLFSPERIPREKTGTLTERKEVLLTELEKYDLHQYKAVAFLDTTQIPYISNIDVMLVAQSIGIKTVNGYSSYCPQDLVEFTKFNREEGLYSWLESNEIKREDILFINKDID